VKFLFEDAGFCVPKKLMSGSGDFVFDLGNHTITLTHYHYIPVNGSLFAAAGKACLGDQLSVLVWGAGGEVVLSPIVKKRVVTAVGLYNPYLVSGGLFVDGVLASSHSSWFLEPYLEAATIVPTYQALFAPLALLYYLHTGWFQRFHNSIVNFSGPLKRNAHLAVGANSGGKFLGVTTFQAPGATTCTDHGEAFGDALD